MWSWTTQYPHGKCISLANNDNAWNGVKSFFAQDTKYVISTLNPYLPQKGSHESAFLCNEVFSDIKLQNGTPKFTIFSYRTTNKTWLTNHVTNATDKFNKIITICAFCYYSAINVSSLLQEQKEIH